MSTNSVFVLKIYFLKFLNCAFNMDLYEWLHLQRFTCNTEIIRFEIFINVVVYEKDNFEQNILPWEIYQEFGMLFSWGHSDLFIHMSVQKNTWKWVFFTIKHLKQGMHFGVLLKFTQIFRTQIYLGSQIWDKIPQNPCLGGWFFARPKCV